MKKIVFVLAAAFCCAAMNVPAHADTAAETTDTTASGATTAFDAQQYLASYTTVSSYDYYSDPHYDTEGNAELIQRVIYASAQMQFISVTTKDGHVFYIIIDYADAGREGECIFRYVYMLTGCSKPVLRLWISSLEESAIRQGFAALKPISAYDNLFAAGYARAKADWLIGINGSRLFSALFRVKGGISVGRVQTPTLAMIVQRDAEISGFVKKPYYTVELDCGCKAVSERFADKTAAEALQAECSGQTATVSAIRREKKTENPPKLYHLTGLQVAANKMFGYTAEETLNYAQSLYEAKLLTYPRTDSNYITADMEQTVTALIGIASEKMPVAAGTVPDAPDVKRLINDSKVSDHHALLPTAEIANINLSGLPLGERNILSLVAARLIAAVGTPHVYEAVSAEITCAGALFTATGRTVMQEGWKGAAQTMRGRMMNAQTDMPEDDETEDTLPQLTEGQTFEHVHAAVAEHFSKPPKPYTDATLLSAMERAGNESYDKDADIEKKGIGTQATRAAVIEGLLKRGYIIRRGKQIHPTEKGKLLIQVVPQSLKSAKTTAEWETVLQQIERGKSDITGDEFTEQIAGQVRRLIRDELAVPPETRNNPFYPAPERTVIGTCPKCGKPVVGYPKSYACSFGKNGCGFVIWKTMCGREIPPEQAKKQLELHTTDLIRGFTNKAGRTFDAYVILKSDNTVGFAFSSREN